MASGTADFQRDLGGAIMQSIFGALLTELTKSFSSAADTAGALSAFGPRQHHRGRQGSLPSGRLPSRP
jgi:MFS transporter, DHA2 family, multidrug resistance protein